MPAPGGRGADARAPRGPGERDTPACSARPPIAASLRSPGSGRLAASFVLIALVGFTSGDPDSRVYAGISARLAAEPFDTVDCPRVVGALGIHRALSRAPDRDPGSSCADRTHRLPGAPGGVRGERAVPDRLHRARADDRGASGASPRSARARVDRAADADCVRLPRAREPGVRGACGRAARPARNRALVPAAGLGVGHRAGVCVDAPREGDFRVRRADHLRRVARRAHVGRDRRRGTPRPPRQRRGLRSASCCSSRPCSRSCTSTRTCGRRETRSWRSTWAHG